MHGFYNRILKIDLSQKNFSIETISDEVPKSLLGGKGLCAHFLSSLNPPGVDPLSPENCLIFATGPSAGSTVLAIHPAGVDFHEAGDIWGMETYAAEDAVMERFGKSNDRYPRKGAVVIGPAGEKRVCFAVIENNYWRSAGRTGVGTVMGAKQLKAILFQGDQKRSLYDEKAVREFSKNLSATAKDSPAAKAYKALGTPMMVKLVNAAGAFTIEAARQGRIDYKIDYGDVDAIAQLLHKMAFREDIGDTLAGGIREAAKQWQLEDLAVHVKELEPAGYDPRVLKGMGLGYATSDRGACHLRATFYKPEISGMIPPGQIEGKAELFMDFEDRLTLFDTLILCRFYRDFYDWDQLEKMIYAVTGIAEGKEGLRQRARQIADLIRRFNLREGLKPEDDRLPKIFHRKLEDSGQVITEEELESMLQDYYRLHGWDKKGNPGS